ncbi:MAG: exonuclease SbcCD subunit D [Brevinematales bacterium]|nr:exonuclease SbcCD subunit D [Brevinematales bacterium]
MKILHTSDWHLGVKVPYLGEDRIEEQEKIVQEIEKIIEERNIDVVIISGDIYENPIPSSKVEKVFYKFIANVCGDMNKYVFSIAGNHDSIEKLDSLNIFSKVFNNRFKNFYIGSSYNPKNLVFDLNGLAFIGIPFIPRFKYSGEYQNIFETILRDTIKTVNNSYVVLLSHDTIEGVNYSNTEVRYDDKTLVLSSIYKVPNFNRVLYWGLGHIHKYHEILKNRIYYSGSIVQIDFGEKNQQKGVIVVDISESNIEADFVELKQKSTFVEYEVKEDYELDKIIEDEKENENFVKIKINKETISESLIRTAYSKLKNLIILKQRKESREVERDLKDKDQLNLSDVIGFFKKFCKEKEKMTDDKIEKLTKKIEEIIDHWRENPK